MSVIPHWLCVFLIICFAPSGIKTLLQGKSEGYYLAKLKKVQLVIGNINIAGRLNIYIFDVFFYYLYTFLYPHKDILLKMETKRVVSLILSLSINGIITTAADKINDTATLVSFLGLFHSFPGFYDHRIPPYDDDDEVYLSIKFEMKSILEIDEVQGALATVGSLIVNWRDHRLAWDPMIHRLINIYVPQEKVWKPYLVLENGIRTAEELGSSRGLIEVSHDGYVFWRPFAVFTSQCQIEMTYYPYDKQTCDITFKLRSYRVTDVVITGADFVKEHSYSNSIWDIESMTTNLGTTDAEIRSFVSFRLNLKRKPIFFFVNMILPILIVGFISNTVFIIPSSTGEKTGFSVTMFLSFAVYLTIVSDQLPKNSDKIALINIYIVVEVCLSVLTLVITSVQVRISSRRNSQSVKGIYMILINIAKFKIGRQRSNKVIEISPQPEELTQESHSHKGKDLVEAEDGSLYSWTDVSNSMDLIFLLMFVIFNMITTTVILSVLIYN